MRNKQRGYMLDGLASAVAFVGACLFVAGIFVGFALTTGIPWLWTTIKPWLHSITG